MPHGQPLELASNTTDTRCVGHTCNHPACRCSSDEVHGSLPPLDWDSFRRQVDAAAADPHVERLVIPGPESHLEPDFLQRAEYTGSSGGFRHIRVESNGYGFADAALTRAARAAGVDEFHISVTASNAEVSASIAGTRDTFAQLLGGLENIASAGGTLLSCTVVCARNVSHLAELADLVLRFRPTRVEFYNLTPVRPQQDRLLAPLAAIQPALQEALTRLAAASTAAQAIGFPRCILGENDAAFAPHHMLDSMLSEAACGTPAPPHARLFHCFYGRACAWWGDCQGLAEPYVQRFGWEMDRLQPRETVSRDHDASRAIPRTNREPTPPAAAPQSGSRWIELLAGPDGKPLERTSLWSLEDVSQSGSRVRYRFLLPNGDRYELVLEPRNDAARRLAQTAGFNVTLLPVGTGDRRLVRRLLFTLLPIISRNDDGRLRLE